MSYVGGAGPEQLKKVSSIIWMTPCLDYSVKSFSTDTCLDIQNACAMCYASLVNSGSDLPILENNRTPNQASKV